MFIGHREISTADCECFNPLTSLSEVNFLVSREDQQMFLNILTAAAAFTLFNRLSYNEPMMYMLEGLLSLSFPPRITFPCEGQHCFECPSNILAEVSEETSSSS